MSADGFEVEGWSKVRNPAEYELLEDKQVITRLFVLFSLVKLEKSVMFRERVRYVCVD